MNFKHVNLWRTMPVCAAIGAVLYFSSLAIPGDHPFVYAFTFCLSLFLVVVFVLNIRLGRLPWFETKDGRKQGLMIWLENKIPFLRAEFYLKK